MKNYPHTIKPFEEIIKEFQFSYLILSKESKYLEKLNAEGEDISLISYFKKNVSSEEFIRTTNKLYTELERKFVMELVASFEAKTVYYYRNIVKRKSILNNANISEYTRKVIKNHQRNLMFTHIGDIFLYEIQPINNRTYTEFLTLMYYRNWLAHGRGWDHDPRWNKFGFQNTLSTIYSILTLITDYPENLKN